MKKVKLSETGDKVLVSGVDTDCEIFNKKDFKKVVREFAFEMAMLGQNVTSIEFLNDDVEIEDGEDEYCDDPYFGE